MCTHVAYTKRQPWVKLHETKHVTTTIEIKKSDAPKLTSFVIITGSVIIETFPPKVHQVGIRFYI